LGINYHLGKANVVADALSRRSHLNQLIVEQMPFDLCELFDKLNLRLVANTEVVALEIDSTLLEDIRKSQLTYEKIQEIKWNIKEGKSPGFAEDDQGMLWYKGRICVPDVKEIKNLILQEAHDSGYSIHPGGNKMYQDLKVSYWWYGMKREFAEYIALFALHVKESSGIVTTIESAWMEMGRNRYGFYRGVTKNTKGIWFYLGYSRQIDQGCPFHTHQDNIYHTSVGRTIHFENSLSSWCA
jgi:hypothetical protein